MNSPTSLAPIDDLETTMLKVARALAMGIYQLEDILKNNNVEYKVFQTWSSNPRFLDYLKSEREAWNSANNVAERTKLKAAFVMEEFLLEAHTGLHDRKIALNHRVELGKLVAKIAGMGESKVINGAGGGGFQLNINIGPGQNVTIRPEMKVIDNNDFDDGYDPLSSPNTLED